MRAIGKESVVTLRTHFLCVGLATGKRRHELHELAGARWPRKGATGMHIFCVRVGNGGNEPEWVKSFKG